MTKDLTVGRPFRILLQFSLPVIGGNLFQLFYTLADSVIVGRTIGSQALAAVGNTSIIIYLILCFIQGITSGFGILLGQAYGSKNLAGMRRSIASGAILSVLFTIVVTTVSCLAAGPILRAMNTPEEIFQLSYDYMFIIFLGTGATVFYNLISNILRALGDSRTPLIFLIFSSLLNILLAWVFIVPFGMGVAGAAWAANVCQLLSAILCTIYAVRHFEVLRLSRGDWNPGRAALWEHLKLGFPMGFQMSVMCIGQLAMQAAVNRLGTDAIAGYTAATKVDQLSVLVNNAFGVTCANYVAQNYGAGLVSRIKRGVTDCFLITEAGNLLMGILTLVCQPWVVPLFIEQPTQEIYLYARDYLWVVVPFYLVLGVLLVYRSAIQSMGNTAAPFAACIVELVLRVVGALLLSQVWGYRGICFSSPMAWIGASALLLPVYFLTIRRMEARTTAEV